MGTAVFYTFTMLLLAICCGTACISGFAYASSGRRIYILLAALFALYSLEVCEVFYFEFAHQGQALTEASYYVIDAPLTRAVVAAAAQACVQLAASWLVDRDGRKVTAVLGVVFVAASMAVVAFVPAGPFQQWLYYTLRQVALAGTLIYLGVIYRTTGNVALKTRLSKHLRRYAALWALLAAIVVEDTLVILVLPMGTHPVWSLIYLSDRNFSESAMIVLMAYWVVRSAQKLLSIRLREAPTTDEVDNLESHIEEQMERVRLARGISEREAEVLRLVVLGKTNHEIATALYLAEGTVKKHVHNIMVKTETKSREALVLAFWKA